MANNAENVSIWWRHHVIYMCECPLHQVVWGRWYKMQLVTMFNTFTIFHFNLNNHAWLGSPSTLTRELNNTHPTIMNSDYNIIRTILVLSYQYSVYQKQTKACIKAKIDSVAMSPRNIGDKYRCRPHLRSHKCACKFLRVTERFNRSAPHSGRHMPTDHAVCSKASFLSHTAFYSKARR